MKQELRFGTAAEIYYSVKGERKPAALDLLDQWFPGLIAAEEPGEIRRDAEYDDVAYLIRAVRIKGKLYTGNDDRTVQILGRLNGTAKGNQEKERKTAELIRKHLAYRIVEEQDTACTLLERCRERLAELDEEERTSFHGRLYRYALAVMETRARMDEYTRSHEPFPMDEEVFSRVLYNAVYQLNLQTFPGLCNAWLWLLFGGLLRNEAGRVCRVYDSSWVPVYREMSETPALADKIDYLLHPEHYEYVYEGDDPDARFPGVEWYCDHCRAHLNEQPGFDDLHDVWVCTRCGHENRISAEEIYDSREDWLCGRHTNDPVKFADAVRRRREKQ